MRLSELVGLNLSDYSRDNRTLRVLGKGRKERIIYLNDACVSALDEYIDTTRPHVEQTAIFLSANKTRINKQMNSSSVQDLVIWVLPPTSSGIQPQP